MLRSTTAQQALVAELLGDMRELIERAESFEATMDKARDAMGTAVGLLDSRIEPFRHALAAEIGQTQTRAIRAFVYQTNTIAHNEGLRQTEAMTKAARTIVEQEMVGPLRQLAGDLQRLIDEARRPWRLWLSYGATAAVCMLASGGFVLYFFGR